MLQLYCYFISISRINNLMTSENFLNLNKNTNKLTKNSQNTYLLILYNYKKKSLTKK